MDPLNAYSLSGVQILRLSGSEAERAFQHAKVIQGLSEKELQTLPIVPLSRKNQSLIDRAFRHSSRIPALAKNALIQSLILAYEKSVFSHQRNLDERFQSRIEAFLSQTNLSKRNLILSLYQPDMLMVLAAITGERVSPHFLSGMPGCSSGIVRTGSQGNLTLLRNLDYPAAGHWEKWPTVFYHEPSETRFQKFVSVGSLGIHLAGLTGVNESGIAFSLHAHFSKKFSLRGAPIFFLGQEILESAHSIDEAIFLCKNFRTIGSWAINLASQKENRAVTIELSDGKVFTREMSPDDPAHAHSNGFQCPEFQKEELHFSGSFLEDVESRKRALEEALSKKPPEGFLSMAQALDALGSHLDFKTRERRIFGNTVSVVTTIQSLAIDLNQNELLISIRNETPTALGPYLTLPLDWKKIPEALTRPQYTSLSTSPPPNFLEALHGYHRAYLHWQVLNDGTTASTQKTLEYLIHATEQLESDPHLQTQRGYFELLNARTEGHFRTALHCFERALQEKLSSHHQQVVRYFRGACLDLLGRHEEALDEYQLLVSASGTDPKLLKKASKRLKSPFQSAYCQKIVPDLQFVEPLEYP